MYFLGRITLLILSLLTVYAELGDLRLGTTEEVDIEIFPFMVSIQYMPPGHTCGGSLVTSQWVLTAAHCLLDDRMQRHPTDNWKVVAGTSYNGRPGSIIWALFGQQVRNVLSTHPHPNLSYMKNSSMPVIWDLGLLQVDRPYHWSSWVQPAQFAPRERVHWSPRGTSKWFGTRVYCPGWKSHWKSTPARRYLYARALTIINTYVCIVGFKASPHPTVLEGWICVWGDSTGNICKGNSGSPLLSGGKVMGVASFTCAGCSKDCPSVFMPVDENFVRKIVDSHTGVGHSTFPTTLAPSLLAMSFILVAR